MTAIVRRAAIESGETVYDLLPIWEQEVAKAVKRNLGNYDSRSYAIAAESFLGIVGVTLSKETFVADKAAQAKKNLRA